LKVLLISFPQFLRSFSEAMTTVAAPEKSASEQAALDKQLSSMQVAIGLLTLSIGTCVPARAPLVLAMKKGDAAATAQTMGLMSTTAAAIELLLNPVLGRLSDKYGRKPFLVMAAAVSSFLHAWVAAFPQNLRINFMDRCITGAMIFAFVNPIMAGLGDLMGATPQMGLTAAKFGSTMGIGFAAGPLLGSKLGGEKAFAVSALGFAATAAYVHTQVGETLAEDKRKEFDIKAINPVSFLQLFKTKEMSTLCTTIGLSSFAEYANIYDINFLYLKTVMDWGQEQVGRFAAIYGVTQILGGRLSSELMKKPGIETYTKMANAAYILGFALLGSAKNQNQIGAALLFLMFGHQRSSEPGLHLQAHATASGMGRGEFQGASANFLAVLKIIAPMMYGRTFANFSTKGMPGAPYFLICAFIAASQATFMTYDKATKP